MQVGIHLPHIGRKAGPDAIRRAAVQAEELGFADVWVSEHIIIPKDAQLPAIGHLLGSGADADLGRRVHAARQARHQRAGAADAPSAAARQGTGDVAEPVAGTADPRRRRRLDGGRVRRARRAVPRARPAHGRGHRDDAGGVERRPGDLPDALDPGEDRHDAHAAEAMRADPDLDRRLVGRGDRARAAAGWLARQSRDAGAGAGDGAAAARRCGRMPRSTISLRTSDEGRDSGALRGRLEAYKAAGVQHVLVAPEERGIEEYLSAVERVARCAEGV